jgi:superfamily II DNA or RNA helicase
MSNKLLPYQIEHVEKLKNIIINNDRALDMSDTGTGKTYTAIALATEINKKPFIVCPKSVILNWVEVLNFFDINDYEIISYGNIFNHKFMIKDDDNNYTWIINDITKNYLFIFDEVHKCKNHDTISAKILLSLSNNMNNKILMLSATSFDKLGYFYTIGYVLNLYDSISKFKFNFLTVYNSMIKIHNLLIKDYASRMCINNINNIFKDNKINMDPIYIEDHYKIDEQYKLMNELKKIKKTHKNKLASIQLMRQNIEFFKVNLLYNLTNKYLNESKSICIFVNYTKTLLELGRLLNTQCFIYGKQTLKERNNNIKNFCSDKSRVIICNIQSGGCGISLHDTLGNYPRISLISPSWSAQDIIQVLGRIHRAMALSETEQYILFCANTFEEKIGNILQKKINDIHKLNNGDKTQTKLILSELKKFNNNDDEQNKDFDILYEELTNLYNEKEIIERKFKGDELKIKLDKINKNIERKEKLLES